MTFAAIPLLIDFHPDKILVSLKTYLAKGLLTSISKNLMYKKRYHLITHQSQL